MKKILIAILLFITLCSFTSKKLDGGTFDADIYIIISEDTSCVKQFALDSANLEIQSEDLNARGATFYSYGNPIMIWFPIEPSYEILNHELMHTVIFIMQWVGVPLSDDTNEVYAFEMQYLTKQYYAR